MTDENPLVSIIIPTYNRAQLIGETLDSVLAQTYQNWECIVVDDGSTDDTQAVVQAYVQKDPRFQYHHRPPEHLPGGNGARNYGFKVSRGEYVNWLDDDDSFSENKIKEQVVQLIINDGDIATCKWARFINTKNVQLKELEIYKNYCAGLELIKDYGEKKEFFPSHIFLLKKSIIFNAGLWNEYLKINQDGEFFCRVLINSRKVVFSQSCWVLYRIAGIENTSRVQNKEKAEHMLLSWRMIESYLRIIDINLFEKYIESGKNYCYFELKKKHKSIIKENRQFFKQQIKDSLFLSRLKRKLF